ncbi:MAG TPA: hypothetical protein VN643_21710 [Pyrinomonadaceae bacterium]|nr:hypothetical protein [Pyrinomonadaceae bacterium]
MKDNKSILNRKLGELAGAVMFVALVCLTTMLSSQNASAASNPREKYMVLGTIENIDSAANTITVRLFDGTDKSMQLSKRLMVNGRAEKRTRAESRLMPQERAVIYYANKGSDETAVDVESLNHAMRKTITGALISADKDNMTLVIRTARGKDETFRVQSDAVIETGDSVMTFTQFEANPGTQIVLHYQDPLGMTEVRRVKR